MSISGSANDRKRVAVTGAKERSTTTTPITLSERSITGLALIRMFVGYLWFQQLFWKMPPDFRGLYPYIIRESQHTIIPGYGYMLQHTFLTGCSSLSAPAGYTAFVPLAACVWTAELLVSISLMFGLFTRFGAILATILSLQLYVGLTYTVVLTRENGEGKLEEGDILPEGKSRCKRHSERLRKSSNWKR
jgi:uncharacterized membrane protein YphA (DoxX/SURF4 family)